MANHGRCRRHAEDSVAHQRSSDGDHNRLVSTPVLIGKVGTQERHDVGPELVDLQLLAWRVYKCAKYDRIHLTKRQTSRCTLAHAQRTGDTVALIAIWQRARRRALRQRPLDEVDDCLTSKLANSIDYPADEKKKKKGFGFVHAAVVP